MSKVVPSDLISRWTVKAYACTCTADTAMRIYSEMEIERGLIRVVGIFLIFFFFHRKYIGVYLFRLNSVECIVEDINR